MDTVVRTRQGAVRGATVDGIAVFKGIPYAAPPFGARRFQPPQPAAAWHGVRDALTYHASAITGVLICTSSPGGRPRLMGGWARVTPWRFHLSSTRSLFQAWRCSWEQRPTMHFDASSELLKDPRSAERALWEGLR